MAHRDFKELTTRIAFEKILHDKAFNIAKIPNYDEYQSGLASMVYKVFDKKTAGGATENEILSNKEYDEELKKPFSRKFKKWKVSSSFIDNDHFQ